MSKNKKNKRRIGDRKDGYLIRDIDPMHFICPLLYPNRCDNEAYINEKIDLTNLNAYLKVKNANKEPGSLKYSIFMVIIAAMLKALYLRPKMNRFIANKNMYQRNEITASFVVRKGMNDDAEEGLAFIHSKPTDNIDTIYTMVNDQINQCRKEEQDQSSKEMDIFNRLPRFLSKFLVHLITRLDIKGRVPRKLIDTDPYYSSVVLTHLGSIKLHAGYHHLTNWGTNSIFVAVGDKKKRPFFNSDGSYEMKDSIDLGLTIDERIADGFYYSKTIRLIKKLLDNPELLELPLEQEIEY